MWGFLGDGVVDTRDSARAYRRPFVDGLLAAGHAVVFLQPDRDLLEARRAPLVRYRWDLGFPDLDALIFEWRWPAPGRNTTDSGHRSHQRFGGAVMITGSARQQSPTTGATAAPSPGRPPTTTPPPCTSRRCS